MDFKDSYLPTFLGGILGPIPQNEIVTAFEVFPKGFGLRLDDQPLERTAASCIKDDGAPLI